MMKVENLLPSDILAKLRKSGYIPIPIGPENLILPIVYFWKCPTKNNCILQ